jgi:hypothetical protein
VRSISPSNTSIHGHHQKRRIIDRGDHSEANGTRNTIAARERRSHTTAITATSPKNQ